MKTIKKRILALWMAVCMALTMMPSMAMPVWAEDATISAGSPKGGTLVAGQSAENITIKLTATNSDFNQVSDTDDDKFQIESTDGILGLDITKVNATGSDMSATVTLSGTPDKAGNFKIKVSKTAFATEPQADSVSTGDITVAYPSGSVKAAFAESGKLTQDESAVGTKVALTADGTLNFKDASSGAVNFTPTGAGAAGLSVTSAEGSAKTVTLTLGGTPTNEGAVNFQINNDAFVAAPQDQITTTGTVTVAAKAVKKHQATLTSESTIKADAVDPTVELSSEDNFNTELTANDFEIDPGTTGLTFKSAIGSSKSASLTFSGTAEPGTIKVQAKNSAFSPNENLEDLSAEKSFEIKNNKANLKTIKIKGVEVTGAQPISATDALGFEIEEEDYKIGTVTLPYALASDDSVAESFAYTPEDDSLDVTTVDAYIQEEALTGAVNLTDGEIETTKLENNKEISEDIAGETKWIVIKATAADEETVQYYVVKAICEKASSVATLESVEIKGKSVEKLGTAITELSNVNASSRSSQVGRITLSYAEAQAEVEKLVATPTDSKAKCETHVLEEAPTEAAGQNVDFGSGGDIGAEKTALGSEVVENYVWLLTKVTAEDKSTNYYLFKVTILPAATTTELASATIKGAIVPVDQTKKLEESGLSNLNLEKDNSKYVTVSLPYEATEDKESAWFDGTATNNGTVEAKVFTVESANDVTINYVGSSEIDETEVDPKGETKWVVIQVKSEDKKTTTCYYIVKLEIAAAVGDAELASATVKGVPVTLKAPIKSGEDNTNGTNVTLNETNVGEVTLEYAQAKENTEVLKLAVTKTADSEGATITASLLTNPLSLAAGQNLNGEGSTFTVDTDKTAIDDSVAGGTKWIVVKVTAKNTTDINYYVIKVTINAASDKAELTGITSVKGRTEELTVPKAITSGVAGGTADLTAGNGNVSTVNLTYEQGANTNAEAFIGTVSPQATYKVYNKTELNETTTQTLTGGNELKNGTIKNSLATGSDDADQTVWLVVEVTAENGSAKNYYVFKVVIGKKYIITDGAKPGEPGLGKYDADLSADVTQEKITITTADGLTEALNSLALKLSTDTAYSEDALEQLADDDEFDSGVYLHVVTTLEVEVKNYDEVTGAITYDVTPMYKLVASSSKSSATENAKDVDNGVKKELDVPDGTTVVFTLPVPSVLSGESKVYVTHKADTGEFVYEATVTEGKATITDTHGFSEFRLTKEDPTVATYNGNNYTSLTAAVEAALASEPDSDITIMLKKQPDPSDKPVVNEAVTIKLKADTSWTDAQDSAELVENLLSKGNNVDLEVTGQEEYTGAGDHTLTYTFTEKEPAPSGPSGSGGSPTTPATVTVPTAANGSVSVSNTNAKAGDTVTVTPKANDGYEVDKVTVTDKNGAAVEVKDNGDGTYSFTMPVDAAQPVTVSVTFKESEGGEVTPPTADALVFSSASQEEAIKNRITTNADTSLKLKAADEGVNIGSLTDWTVESDDESVVKVLEPSNKLRYMGAGTAHVTVTAKGDNDKVYSIVITINVKPGTPTFTLSHYSSKKARTFTVTTSTVRGATGFQVKYSLKKSLKSSKTKTYACGKKLIRKTIKANKSKRTYYVRVRAYQTVNGERVYGAWSKLTKTIKSK